MEYNEEHFEYIKNLVQKEGSKVTPAVKSMCKNFDLPYDDNIRRIFASRLQRERITNNVRVIEDSDEFKKARGKKFDKRRNTFIFTWAQNETPVHRNFFDNIIAYSKERKAGVHVILGRYKNPTSVFTDQDKDTWVPEVLPYADANRHNIHKYLQILSDIKISPTASMPLSSLNSVTGLESCIVGHPRQHLKSLPVLESYPNKLLMSTGACTVENYTDSKSGKKSEFHHNLGCIVVELDGDYYHIRQITADDDGNFYDLFHRVKDGVVSENTEGCVVAVLGDLHIANIDKYADKKTFQLLDIMQPKYTICHDIFDGESVSHHDKNDPFKMLFKEEEGLDVLSVEIEGMMKWIEKRLKYNLVFTRGNHEDFLDRWLKFSDWRKEGNKKDYLKYANIVAERLAPKGVIPYLIEERFGDSIITLGIDDSFRILEWELSIHGHIGASGSRGGHTQFKNLNTKNVTAHGHHPHREDGHLAVGTLTKLKLGYNVGMSNWMHSNVLIYPDGKAQHVHLVNGKFHR